MNAIPVYGVQSLSLWISFRGLVLLFYLLLSKATAGMGYKSNTALRILAMKVSLITRAKETPTD